MTLVLLGDMSSTTRRIVVGALQDEPDMQSVGELRPKDDVVALIKQSRPNLIIIGIGAKGQDPYETTKRIMAEAPTPIVLITNGDDVGDVQASVHALQSGALAVLSTPESTDPGGAEDARRRFVAALRAMSEVKVVRRWRETGKPREGSPAPVPRRARSPRLIAIAASTGGPAALQQLLSDLPPDFPVPILVVQHIANGFTEGLVQWLNTVCSLTVKIAVHGEAFKPRTVYFAADGSHLGVSRRATIMLSDEPPIDGFRPAANFLFDSAAKVFGQDLAVVVLTGMGRDGVAGLRTVRQLGGDVIAQDEASSVVYGMPRAAYEEGLVDSVLPLSFIAPALMTMIDNSPGGGG